LDINGGHEELNDCDDQLDERGKGDHEELNDCDDQLDERGKGDHEEVIA
jgi:hypothetical protein